MGFFLLTQQHTGDKKSLPSDPEYIHMRESLSLFVVRSGNLLSVEQTGFTNAATRTPAGTQCKR
jgi:hypothetical protein